MRLLLDTHALLWWAAGDRRLSKKARSATGDGRNEVHVSAASAWEIAIKCRLGKLRDAGPLATELSAYLRDQEFTELPISIAHAQRTATLPELHRDPFDRILVAQCQVENFLLVSNEELFDGYGIRRWW